MTVVSEKPAAPAEDSVQQIFQLGTAYILSSALQVALQLRVAERLADGPRTTTQLAAESGVNEDALYRMLRALASVGVFQETKPREFAPTPAADALREPAVRDMMVWMTDPFHFRVYADAMHSVKTGLPAAEKTTGAPVFEHFARDPDLSEVFHNAMTAFSSFVIPAVLDAYDFSDVRVLVDVAGGHGRVLTSILERYPSMRGILFDLEHVIESARPRIAAAGFADRCETKAGDFFTAVPASGDAYIMKHIIHDWDDDKAATILRNIRAVLPRAGRVILLEGVMAPGNQPDFTKLIDIEMLLMPGGRERTEEEFRRLFDSAGFNLTRIVPTRSPLSVIEARPKA